MQTFLLQFMSAVDGFLFAAMVGLAGFWVWSLVSVIWNRLRGHSLST